MACQNTDGEGLTGMTKVRLVPMAMAVAFMKMVYLRVLTGVLLGRVTATTSVVHFAGPLRIGSPGRWGTRVPRTIGHHVLVLILSMAGVRCRVDGAVGIGTMRRYGLTMWMVGRGWDHSLRIMSLSLRVHGWNSGDGRSKRNNWRI